MSAGLKKESCYQHVSLLACYLISNPIVSCLNHFNNIISACFPKYTLFWDKKRTAIVLLSFRRRYFTMGIVKIYNVLGGFYVNYSTIFPFKSVHKLHKSYTCFLYTLYSTFFPFSKKTFSLASTPPLSQLQHQLRSGIMLQIHLFQSFLFPKEGLLIYGVHHYFPE